MLATDAQGKPVEMVHHRVERGINGLDGKWCVIEVTRRLTQTGDVASVRRCVVDIRDTKTKADEIAALLDR